MKNRSLPEIHDVKIDQIQLRGLDVGILRLDEIDPEISGNKWFKLKYNIDQAIKSGNHGLLTFGGAFSNHIAAVAAAGKLSGLKTIGIIRGEAEYKSNPTLSRAIKNGMQLQFVSRSDFKKLKSEEYLDYWHEKYPMFSIVPEGGSNELGVKGASEIMKFIPSHYNSISVAMGTGGTVSGLLLSNKNKELHAYPVLKMGTGASSTIQQLIGYAPSNFTIHDEFHFGGYAKYNAELLKFIRAFHDEYKIKLDPVYTGKLMFGVCQDIEKGILRGNPLIIHTGGLQGIAGFEMMTGQDLFSQKDH